jgi:hypothetical protein
MKSNINLDVTLCSLVDIYRRMFETGDVSTRNQLPPCFLLVAYSTFLKNEGGHSSFLRNAGEFVLEYTVSQLRR